MDVLGELNVIRSRTGYHASVNCFSMDSTIVSNDSVGSEEACLKGYGGDKAHRWLFRTYKLPQKSILGYLAMYPRINGQVSKDTLPSNLYSFLSSLTAPDWNGALPGIRSSSLCTLLAGGKLVLRSVPDHRLGLHDLLQGLRARRSPACVSPWRP